MTCVVCYDGFGKRRGKQRVKCPQCVASWCVSCHEKFLQAFVKQTFEHIEDLDTKVCAGLSCPCCRCLMDARTACTHPLQASYLVDYVDGIYEFVNELLMIERTNDWLKSNSTWISATRDNDRIRQTVTKFDSIIHELEHRMSIHQDTIYTGYFASNVSCDAMACTHGCNSCQCKVCQAKRGLYELRIECDAYKSIKERSTRALERGLHYTARLFYCRATSTPISDVLQSFNRARGMTDSCNFARLDKYGAPMSFHTFLQERVGYILELMSKSDYLLRIIHFCRKRNMLLDLVHGLQMACRKSSHTGVNRWLKRTELGKCPVDAKFQLEFMRCVYHACSKSNRE
jgi:hypothetical protein